MTKLMIVLLYVAMAYSQPSGQNTSADANQQDVKTNNKDAVTVTGCVSRSHKHFVLIQAHEGNSYQLEDNNQVKLGSYLGQEVEVTGQEFPTLSTSSDSRSGGAASSVTISVRAIKSIHKTCSY
jgi:hypothetical protein